MRANVAKSVHTVSRPISVGFSRAKNNNLDLGISYHSLEILHLEESYCNFEGKPAIKRDILVFFLQKMSDNLLSFS